MREIILKKITWPTFSKEEFYSILTKDYEIIKDNPCTDVKFVLNEERVSKEEFDYILHTIKNHCYHCNVKREDIKGLPSYFIYPPFVIEPILISEILGYYFHKMSEHFDLEILMEYKHFIDFEYYRDRAKQLYDILKDEDIEYNIYYIELINHY